MPLLTYKNKSIYFIHIPKTGGSSLYEGNLLRQGVTIDYYDTSPQHECTPQHYHIKILEKKFPGYVKLSPFTILRDPWHRTCSEYNWYNKLAKGRFATIESYLVYVLEYYYKNNYACDNHLRPQEEFVNKHVTVFTHENYSAAQEFINMQFGKKFDYSVVEKKLDYKRPDFNDLPGNLKKSWLQLYQKDIDLFNKYS